MRLEQKMGGSEITEAIHTFGAEKNKRIFSEQEKAEGWELTKDIECYFVLDGFFREVFVDSLTPQDDFVITEPWNKLESWKWYQTRTGKGNLERVLRQEF